MSQNASQSQQKAPRSGAAVGDGIAAAEHMAEDVSRAVVGEAVHLANEAPHVADEVVANVDHTIDRIRNINEQIIESASSASIRVLDTYEQTLRTVLDLHLRMAEASQLDWVNAMARAQAQFMLELSNFYTKAARDMLG